MDSKEFIDNDSNMTVSRGSKQIEKNNHSNNVTSKHIRLIAAFCALAIIGGVLPEL